MNENEIEGYDLVLCVITKEGSNNFRKLLGREDLRIVMGDFGSKNKSVKDLHEERVNGMAKDRSKK